MKTSDIENQYTNDQLGPNHTPSLFVSLSNKERMRFMQSLS